MIYNLYIFNRKGKLLYYREYNRPRNTLKDDYDEEKKLMFGLLFSIKELVKKLTKLSNINNLNVGNGVVGGSADLHRLRTSAFTLHHLETPSGLRFILNTDASNSDCDMRPNLHHIYANIFVEYVCKSPNYRPQNEEMITNDSFKNHLDEYMETLPEFNY